jgi:hypothetical protein
MFRRSACGCSAVRQPAWVVPVPHELLWQSTELQLARLSRAHQAGDEYPPPFDEQSGAACQIVQLGNLRHELLITSCLLAGQSHVPDRVLATTLQSNPTAQLAGVAGKSETARGSYRCGRPCNMDSDAMAAASQSGDAATVYSLLESN